jgi:hypothetical protein
MKTGVICVLPAIIFSATASGAPPLPDPTRPPDYTVKIQQTEKPPAMVTDFNVTAIRIDRDDRSAIINGHLVRVGDMVGQARVLEIHPAEVVLYHDQKRRVVRLYDRLLKTEKESSSGAKALN